VASVTASYPQILALAAAVAAIGGGVVWLYGRAASLYHRTLGSRRGLAKLLNQVAAGVTARYLEERFGAPAFVRGSETRAQSVGMTVGAVRMTEQVYRTRHAWLQVLTDEHDAVIRFSITVTDPRFHFRTRDLTNYTLDVKLGRTHFSSVPADPDGRSLWAAVRRHGYSESFWFGNPGNSQRYVLSKNDAGVGSFGFSALPDGISHSYRGGILMTVDPAYMSPPPGTPPYDPAAPYATNFRSGTTINTLTVLSADYGPMALAAPRGPDADFVRVLVSGPWELRQRRRTVRRLNRPVKGNIRRARAAPPDESVSSTGEAPPAS
jgi:hypothetical protein